MKYIATHIVHTPSGPTHACEKHAQQISGLFGFIGAHTVAEKSDGKHQCMNCKNEAEDKDDSD